MSSSQTPADGILLGDGRFVPLAADLVAYLHLESSRRGITEEAVYKEEVRFSRLAKCNALSTDELMELAEASDKTTPLLEDEDCPF